MSRARKPGFRERYGAWGVVAGASQGLGAEFATQLAEDGMNLVLVARRMEPLTSLCDRLTFEYGIQARAVNLDLAEPDAVSTLLQATRELDIGVLVYNAAYSTIGPFWEHSLEDHLTELEVNCRAPLRMLYAFGQKFVERKRGCLIVMSSLSASQGSAYISNYAATKAYNLLLAEGLWEELRGTGVDVLACCAGATRTPGYIASLNGMPDRKREPSAMHPEAVVAETLAAAGRLPSVVPGRSNRISAFLMRRVLPRKAAIHLMGRVLRRMYLR